MPGDLQQRLDSLRSKMQLLLKQQDMLRQANETAETRIKDLLDTVEKQSREIDVLRQQNEHLRVVTTLAPRREDVEKSRAVLAELVREIDKCISDLNE